MACFPKDCLILPMTSTVQKIWNTWEKTVATVELGKMCVLEGKNIMLVVDEEDNLGWGERSI